MDMDTTFTPGLSQYKKFCNYNLGRDMILKGQELSFILNNTY